MSPLPLRSIEAFVVVARERGLGRSASRLGITVPAVSRRLRILEQHLGTRLFDRTPRGLALTAAGERYIAELGPAWDSVRAATEAARMPRRGRSLTVSVIPTFAANWLVPRLVDGHARLRGLDVSLETSADIIELAERRDLDCAVRLGRGPWAGTVSERILPIEAYPVARPGFVAGDRLGGAADLARHTLVGSSHQPDFWPEWFRLNGAAFHCGACRSFDNLQLVYEAAAAGLGIAIGLDPLVRPYVENGRLVRLRPDAVTLSRSFHLVRRADGAADRRVARFGAWLRTEAARAA
ncbi:LysR substrate-binding domain-containing protein [Reyranella sp.]|uniref:LysR substrate-binding domain-containing protein n=1 Tax=Reyranella sp. TaxID=1929291 RepID=UPI003BAC6B0C